MEMNRILKIATNNIRFDEDIDTYIILIMLLPLLTYCSTIQFVQITEY